MDISKIDEFNKRFDTLTAQRNKLQASYDANLNILNTKKEEYKSTYNTELDLDDLDNLIEQYEQKIRVDYENGMEIMLNLEKELNVG